MVGSVNQPAGEFGERICRNFSIGWNPIDSGVSAEPSLLEPGESTSTCHRRFERVIEWRSVLDVVKQFGIAKCLTSSTTKTCRAVHKSLYLDQEPIGHLLFVALRNALVEQVAFHRQPHDRKRRSRVLLETRTKRGKRSATSNRDFECSHDASAIRGFHSRCRQWVEALESSKQHRRIGFGFEFGAHIGESGRDFKIVGDCLKVKTGATNQHCTLAAFFNVGEHRQTVTLKPSDGVIVIGIAHIEEVMNNL
jgi:hypothetical protein